MPPATRPRPESISESTPVWCSASVWPCGLGLTSPLEHVVHVAVLDARVEVDRAARDVAEALVEGDRVELRREGDSAMTSGARFLVQCVHHHPAEAVRAVFGEHGDAADVGIALPLGGVLAEDRKSVV